MKYAVINKFGGINRITESEPQFIDDSRTVAELSDADAATVEFGMSATPRIWYRLVNGSVMTVTAALKLEAFLALPLDEAQTVKIAEIAKARYEVEVGGVQVPPYGVIPTDIATQAKLTAVYIKATNDPTYTKNWKVGATTWAVLDAQTIITIGDAVEAHVQAQFDKEETLTAAALAATTVEELVAINW
jgi:hypothetical protein